jgi:hypothetical protein
MANIATSVPSNLHLLLIISKLDSIDYQVAKLASSGHKSQREKIRGPVDSTLRYTVISIEMYG